MNCRAGGWVLLLLLSLGATASGASPVPGVVAREVLASDSLRAHTFTLMARGQVTEACQGVAQNLHTAFTQLGGRPEFVQLATGDPEKYPIIEFKLATGRDASVSHTGYHWLVRMQGRAYDAYTGAAGMPWAEYLNRLGSRAGITETVVESVGGVP